MARVSGLSYYKLAWCTDWYFREETLKAATNAIVNFQYHQPLARLWGGGSLSSSDGQRFPVAKDAKLARALPKYFGYRKGVTFYTWTSDQFSQYGAKVVPSTIRDATCVLDEILGNETELSINEHTTDTSGYTELIFALFDLLDLRFSPRIKDLGEQVLYRTDALDLSRYPRMRVNLPGRIDKERVISYWDDMLRLAGSLKLGYVTSSLFISKLQAYPRQNELTKALQEYGRLPKTIHCLRWHLDEGLRKRVSRQLNKGEAIHALRSYVTIANKGILRRKENEQLQYQVGCLNLVSNAIIAWNTVYMWEAVQQLRAEGCPISDEDLRYIWPSRYEHINVYGRYEFNLDEVKQRQGLRELRKPDDLPPYR
jgi:TnpA family transposase